MPKPKAEAWLREAFRDGVDERERRSLFGVRKPAYFGAERGCWLAQHDPRRRPCSGRLERFHFVNRQRVENALGALLQDGFTVEWREWRTDLILLAAWDARNGGLGCEGHHRRLDGHATPPLWIPRLALPAHVEEFAADWGVETALDDRFGSYYLT